MFEMSPKNVRKFAQLVMSLIITYVIVFFVFQYQNEQLKSFIILIITILSIITTFLASNLNTEE
jgi:c-di-AMP phosphodiesterase-like protein